MDEKLKKLLPEFKAKMEQKTPEAKIKIWLAESGIPFGRVNAAYKRLLELGGYEKSEEEISQIVNAICNAYDISTEDGYKSAISNIMEKAGVNERRAKILVTKWAKEHDKEVWKKQTGGRGRSGFFQKLSKFLKENPTVSEDEFRKFIFGEPPYEPTSDNVKRHYSQYKKVWQLVQDVVAAAKG